MNYRHAYHAGNFADVLKHVVVALIIEHLKQKPQPFRVIDVHAGRGIYDLESIEAGKTREWERGIARVMAPPFAEGAAAILSPYVECVRAMNSGSSLTTYPGSPLLARALMRRGDQLIANELHPEDFNALRSALATQPDSKVLNLDAWVALKSLLPPRERRGLILIDPPFEAPDEFDRLAKGVAEALQRFATGVYVIWYPVKDPRDVTKWLGQLRGLHPAKAINVTLSVLARGTRPGLTEAGLLILNPPYLLKEHLQTLMTELTARLSEGRGSGFRIEDWGDDRGG